MLIETGGRMACWVCYVKLLGLASDGRLFPEQCNHNIKVLSWLTRGNRNLVTQFVHSETCWISKGRGRPRLSRDDLFNRIHTAATVYAHLELR